MVQAMVVTGEKIIEKRMVKLPETIDGILIEILGAGVCGTDIHIVDGTLKGKYPFILGHEFYGKVIEVSPNNKVKSLTGEVKVGDIITVVPGKGCGNCMYCNTTPSLEHLCNKRDTYGINISSDESPFLGGGFAEKAIIISDFYVYHVPKHWKLGLGALLEPVAVAINAVSIGDAHAKSIEKRKITAVVQGAGTIGFFCALALKRKGYDVFVVEPIEERRDRISKYGIKGTISPSEDECCNWSEMVCSMMEGIGPDLVIEAAGTLEAFNQALRLVRKGGTVLEVGNFANIGKVEIEPSYICRNNISILSAVLAPPETYFEAEEILSEVSDKIDDLVLKYSFDDAIEAIENVRTKKSGLKTVIVPKGEM